MLSRLDVCVLSKISGISRMSRVFIATNSKEQKDPLADDVSSTMPEATEAAGGSQPTRPTSDPPTGPRAPWRPTRRPTADRGR